MNCDCDSKQIQSVFIVGSEFYVMCYLFVIVFCLCSPQFPMGAGGDGPLGGMAGMEPHHMNGSLGTATCSLQAFTVFLFV